LSDGRNRVVDELVELRLTCPDVGDAEPAAGGFGYPVEETVRIWVASLRGHSQLLE
jgi:hypothetical protein